jgi:hypothetical protein
MLVIIALVALRIVQAHRAHMELISYLDALGEMLGESLDQAR